MHVLLDTRRKHFEQNSYISDLVALSAEVHFHGFSWTRLIVGRYDVFHVHWPEWLVKHGRPYLQPVMKILMSLALVRLRLSKVPVLRTMHNLAPHSELSPWGASLIGRLEDLTTSRIWLSDAGDRMQATDVVVPHPDYQPWAGRLNLSWNPAPHSRRGLCFGSLVPYRRFEIVAEAARLVPGGKLKIAGAATDRRYTDKLERIASRSEGRVSVGRGRLSEEDLARAIHDSDVIFVPYTDLYNSGIIFLALTLQRPVALPASPAAEVLAAEYGSEWVRQWVGELNDEKLIAIYDRPFPSAPAFSAKRRWESIVQGHREMYAKLSTRERSSRRHRHR